MFKRVLDLYKKEYFTRNLNNKTNYTIDNSEVKKTIEDVVSAFGKYSAKSLSEWSHRKGSAWDKAQNRHADYYDEISMYDIRNEFIEIIKKD